MGVCDGGWKCAGQVGVCGEMGVCGRDGSVWGSVRGGWGSAMADGEFEV